MALINEVSFYFFYFLSFGLLIYLPWIPLSETGAGFYKLAFGLSGGSIFLSFLLGKTFIQVAWPFYLLFLFILVLYGGAESIFRFPFGKYLSFLFLYSNLLSIYFLTPMKIFNQVYFSILTVFFLGGIFFALILGHWYLVVPKMRESLLARVIQVVSAILLLRFFYCGLNISSFLFWDQANLFTKIIFIMRKVWGEFIVFIMLIMTHKLISIRSLQSATGVIYALSFFTIIGELMSFYFFILNGFNI